MHTRNTSPIAKEVTLSNLRYTDVQLVYRKTGKQ